MIAEIHVAPSPIGTPLDKYKHINEVIETISSSGLQYEVSALGTTFEGSDSKVWEVLRKVHEGTIRAGATSNISNIRIFSSVDEAVSIDSLTKKFRDKN